LRYKSIYVKQIPIPQASNTEQIFIESLVQKCLDTKGHGVEKWEEQIDDIVGHLYNLTSEEMKIVRNI